MSKFKPSPDGWYAETGMGPWQWEFTPGEDYVPSSKQDIIEFIINEADAILTECGVDDWQYPQPSEGQQVTPDIIFALSARQWAQFFIDSNYENSAFALRAGIAYGEMGMARIWRTKLAKGGIKNKRKKKSELDARRAALRKYIQKHGDVPSLGSIGKQNPERTRYFQRFRKAFGKTISIDTFNRDVKAICAKPE